MASSDKRPPAGVLIEQQADKKRPNKVPSRRQDAEPRCVVRGEVLAEKRNHGSWPAKRCQDAPIMGAHPVGFGRADGPPGCTVSMRRSM